MAATGVTGMVKASVGLGESWRMLGCDMFLGLRVECRGVGVSDVDGTSLQLPV